MTHQKNTLWPVDLSGLIACVALAGAATVFGVMPALEHRRGRATMQETLFEEQREAEDLERLRSRFERALLDANELYGSQILRLESPRMLNTRLSKLTTLATDCGIEITGLRPGKPERDARYTLIPIQLDGEVQEEVYRRTSTLLARLHDEFEDTGVAGFDTSESVQTGLQQVSISLVWFAASEEIEVAGGTP